MVEEAGSEQGVQRRRKVNGGDDPVVDLLVLIGGVHPSSLAVFATTSHLVATI